MSLLTSFLPVCRGVEADRQETITTRLLLPDTPSDVSIMRTDFHSLAIDHTCVSLDLDFLALSVGNLLYPPHGREYEDCKQILKLSLNPTHT